MATATAYQVFDKPSESALASVSAPEGLIVSINRDAFGKPQAITHSGSYAGTGVSARRRLKKAVEADLEMICFLLNRTRYEAYGNTGAGTVPNSIGFTGHVNDPGTGLVYMQQRYYDPIAARFMSNDPVTTDADTGTCRRAQQMKISRFKV